MAAHQAPLSLGFSRQEHWGGLPFPSPMHEWKVKSQSETEVAQSCPTLHDPMDCSPPGSSIYGIFQARVLEWGALQIWTSIFSRKRRRPWTCILKWQEEAEWLLPSWNPAETFQRAKLLFPYEFYLTGHYRNWICYHWLRPRLSFGKRTRSRIWDE